MVVKIQFFVSGLLQGSEGQRGSQGPTGPPGSPGSPGMPVRIEPQRNCPGAISWGQLFAVMDDSIGKALNDVGGLFQWKTYYCYWHSNIYFLGVCVCVCAYMHRDLLG